MAEQLDAHKTRRFSRALSVSALIWSAIIRVSRQTGRRSLTDLSVLREGTATRPVFRCAKLPMKLMRRQTLQAWAVQQFAQRFADRCVADFFLVHRVARHAFDRETSATQISNKFGNSLKTIDYDLSAAKIDGDCRFCDPTGRVSSKDLRAADEIDLGRDRSVYSQTRSRG